MSKINEKNLTNNFIVCYTLGIETNKETNNMNKFYAGQELSDRSICNSECIFTATVIKRTAKRVTLDTDMYGVKTVGIMIDYEGNEFCFPYGRYSMAATFNA